MRAGYFSRTTAVHKRRSHALTGDSPAAGPPRPAVLLTPAGKAARVAVLKTTWIGKAPTFDTRARGQGGSRP